MKKQVRTVKIDELKMTIFVRQALNLDRVGEFEELLLNGVPLEPIVITSEGRLVDGRHRVDANINVGNKEILAEVVEVSSEIELITMAYKANSGGSLPPNKEDKEHTMMLLLDRGVSHKDIAGYLDLPLSLARKYIKTVKSKAMRKRLTSATAAIVNEGLTAAKAAEKFGVELNDLKVHISGGRRVRKTLLAEITQQLSCLSTSNSQKNASLMRKLKERYEDGDVTKEEVEKILGHVHELHKRSARALANWEERFKSAAKASLAV